MLLEGTRKHNCTTKLNLYSQNPCNLTSSNVFFFAEQQLFQIFVFIQWRGKRREEGREEEIKKIGNETVNTAAVISPLSIEQRTVVCRHNCSNINDVSFGQAIRLYLIA